MDSYPADSITSVGPGKKLANGGFASLGRILPCWNAAHLLHAGSTMCEFGSWEIHLPLHPPPRGRCQFPDPDICACGRRRGLTGFGWIEMGPGLGEGVEKTERLRATGIVPIAPENS